MVSRVAAIVKGPSHAPAARQRMPRPRLNACPGCALTHARPVAIEALGCEFVEIILKAPLGVDAEIAQERPGGDAGGVHVVEAESDSIIADGIDREDGHIALAADGLALRFGMALHFGGGTGDAE